MLPVRNCDFCDDDAVGAFEVLPAELEPTEDEQRRLVLCEGCKGRLEDVLEPLLARLGASPVEEETASSRPTSITIGAADADGDGADAGEDVIDVDGDAADARVPETDSSPAGTTPDDPLSIGDEPQDTTSADDPLSIGEKSQNTASTDTPPAEGSEDGRSNRPPRAYRKVMRLLRNREFPMERTAVEELAAGAYDLEGHEAAAIVDHAIDRGELLENDGTLRRP